VWHRCGTERILQRTFADNGNAFRGDKAAERLNTSLPFPDSEQGGHVLATIFCLVPAAITTGLNAFPLPKFLALSLYQGYLLLAVTGEN